MMEARLFTKINMEILLLCEKSPAKRTITNTYDILSFDRVYSNIKRKIELMYLGLLKTNSIKSKKKYYCSNCQRKTNPQTCNLEFSTKNYNKCFKKHVQPKYSRVRTWMQLHNRIPYLEMQACVPANMHHPLVYYIILHLFTVCHSRCSDCS